MRLRIDHDLMFRIDRGHARIPLDDALIGRHLRALVVGAMALAQTACRAAAIRPMRGEPLAQLCASPCRRAIRAVVDGRRRGGVRRQHRDCHGVLVDVEAEIDD